MCSNLEFNIFDKDKNSYIIGDLLNMPHYFGNWNSNPHHNEFVYNLYKTTCLQYPNNILGIYDKLRIDQNEPIPNIDRINSSIDQYIENNLDKNSVLKNLLDMCEDTNTLFVHLRSGDKHVVDDNFVIKLKQISSNYSKIVILTGIHQNAERSHNFPSVEESINNTKVSLKKIENELVNTELIIDVSEPDIHLSVMRNAKNLLVHIGGFSMIGALAFKGNNLYLTNLFYPLAFNNKEFFNILKKYILL
jgi:hypothetical protein